MNASVDVATTFSACMTTMPVIDSARRGKAKRSTTRIHDVIENIPPDAYSFILVVSFISPRRLMPLVDTYFVGIDDLQSCPRSSIRCYQLGDILANKGFLTCVCADGNDKILVLLIGFLGRYFGIIVRVENMGNERHQTEAASENEQCICGEDILQQHALKWQRQMPRRRRQRAAATCVSHCRCSCVHRPVRIKNTEVCGLPLKFVPENSVHILISTIFLNFKFSQQRDIEVVSSSNDDGHGF
jgi:hypothetical protein